MCRLPGQLCSNGWFSRAELPVLRNQLPRTLRDQTQFIDRLKEFHPAFHPICGSLQVPSRGAKGNLVRLADFQNPIHPLEHIRVPIITGMARGYAEVIGADINHIEMRSGDNFLRIPKALRRLNMRDDDRRLVRPAQPLRVIGRWSGP